MKPNQGRQRRYHSHVGKTSQETAYVTARETGLEQLMVSSGLRDYGLEPYVPVFEAVNLKELAGPTSIHLSVIAHVAPIGAVTSTREQAEELYRKKIEQFKDEREGAMTPGKFEFSDQVIPLYSGEEKLRKPMQAASFETANGIVHLTHHVFDPISGIWRRCGEFGFNAKSELFDVHPDPLLGQFAAYLSKNPEGLYESRARWPETLGYDTDAFWSGDSDPPDQAKLAAVTRTVKVKP